MECGRSPDEETCQERKRKYCSDRVQSPGVDLPPNLSVRISPSIGRAIAIAAVSPALRSSRITPCASCPSASRSRRSFGMRRTTPLMVPPPVPPRLRP